MNLKLVMCVLLAFFCLAFCGCLKKSADDPFLSLRSRRNRVSGEWTVTGGNSLTTYYYTASTSREYNIYYAKNAYSESGSLTKNTGGVLSYKITFDKDGSFESLQKRDTLIERITGKWNFLLKTEDDARSYKKKELLAVHFTAFQAGNNITTYTGNKSNETYHIKELRHKKM